MEDNTTVLFGAFGVIIVGLASWIAFMLVNGTPEQSMVEETFPPTVEGTPSPSVEPTVSRDVDTSVEIGTGEVSATATIEE